MKWTDVNSKNLLALMVLFILIFSIQACATGHKRRQGRLSDAMRKASDKNHGSRQVEAPKHRDDYDGPPSYPTHSEPAVELEKESSETTRQSIPDIPDSREIAETGPEKPENPFGLSGGVGLLKSDDFSEMIGLDISIGLPKKKSRIDLYVGCSWAGIDRTSELDSSIDGGVTLFGLGLNYKYKLSEDPKWNTPYFLIGGAYKRMHWSYENNIITADGETITSDSLDGFELYAGFGKKLLRTNDNSFGIEVYPAFILWHSDTEEGFENDVFDPFLMLNIRAVFSAW